MIFLINFLIKILKQEWYVKNKLIIREDEISDEHVEKVRFLTIGDIMSIDFEKIVENHKPITFYIHYSTVKGDALGKLILTDYEMMFEPLNKSLKGFINQNTDDFFNNKKLQFSIAYEDLHP